MQKIDLVKLKKETLHFPVMIREILSYLDFGGKDLHKIVLDCTFGAGGYSSFILENFPNYKVIAIDRDENTLPFADSLSNKYPDRFQFFLSKFSEYDQILLKLNLKVDAIVMDLGFSHLQINDPLRGFSFQKKGKLSMNMGLSSIDAYMVVNNFSEEKLADIIYFYGDEKFAKRIAKNIVKSRLEQPINTTLELAEIIKQSIPFFGGKIHPATKTFQAIRIYVNEELKELEIALNNSLKYLNPSGNLIVVSFHSLEDKITKNFIKKHITKIKINKYKQYSKDKVANQLDLDNNYFIMLTNKVQIPADDEIRVNPPSSSAKLRVSKLIENKV